MYEICIFFTYVSSLWDKYDWFQVRGKILAPLLSKLAPKRPILKGLDARIIFSISRGSSVYSLLNGKTDFPQTPALTTDLYESFVANHLTSLICWFEIFLYRCSSKKRCNLSSVACSFPFVYFLNTYFSHQD